MRFQCLGLRRRQGDFSLEIDLEINGQVIGIFGKSGAGKTSLLEIVAGLRRPDTGSLRIDESVLVDKACAIFLPPERRGFGYVPQDLALFPHLGVRGNLLYGQRPATSGSSLDLQRVASVLELEGLLDRRISQLSGGQKQRVAFGRALLSSPRLLLMDEPLASLDHELRRAIIPYLKRLRDEFRIPMLYVSHAAEEMLKLCDQVVVMADGKCVRTSAPSEIFVPSTSVTLRPGIYPADK